MSDFCKVRNEDPAPGEGRCCNLVAGHEGRHAYKTYRAKETSLGHENNLRGTKVPAYEGRFGMDPGLFGTEQ